jgi:hypothetical protein
VQWKTWAALCAVAITVSALIPGPATAADESVVTVIHAVPGLTADVYVDGQLALPEFRFGRVTRPFELPSGEHRLEIYVTGASPGTSDAALAGTANLEPNSNVTIVAHLDPATQPTMSVFNNDVSTIPSGTSRVVVRQTAAAPPISVLADGEPLFEAVANAEEVQLEIPSGARAIDLATSGSPELEFAPIDLTFAPGAAYFLYPSGDANTGTFELLVQTIRGLGPNPNTVPSGNAGLRPPAGEAATPPAAISPIPQDGVVLPADDQAGSPLATGGEQVRWASTDKRAVLRTEAALVERVASLVPRPVPTRVVIAGLDIDAPVRAVGLDDSGDMELPTDAGSVGWFAPGATPGREGSAVMAGHVDLAGVGPAVFFRLEELEMGSEIGVLYDDGSRRRFTAIERRTYPWNGLPAAEMFATEGPSVLFLVTCGGTFDAAAQRYLANVVVVALPVLDAGGERSNG